jgi:hypothetical protein
MDNPLKDRRLLLEKATNYLFDAAKPDTDQPRPDDDPPRLTLKALEKIRMSRSRERVLANLDEMYREAFTRAQAAGDDAQKVTLDLAYRREQLYFEILLDIRDAVEKR